MVDDLALHQTTEYFKPFPGKNQDRYKILDNKDYKLIILADGSGLNSEIFAGLLIDTLAKNTENFIDRISTDGKSAFLDWVNDTKAEIKDELINRSAAATLSTLLVVVCNYSPFSTMSLASAI